MTRTRPSPRPSAPLPRAAAVAEVCAYAAAGLGGANLVTLGLLYAVEVPRNGPYMFGAINDFGGGLYFLASAPVLAELHRQLDDGSPASRAALAAVLGSSAAAAGSSFLLALHKIPSRRRPSSPSAPSWSSRSGWPRRVRGCCAEAGGRGA